MHWVEVFTIIGVNIAIFAVLTTIIIWMVNKLDTDIKSLGNRLDGHAQRIDQLYTIILSMLKDQKNESSK